MSKIAEKKALEAYPKMSRISEPHGIIPADNKSHRLGDANEENREAFIRGYEQATQAIEEFFYDKFNIHPHDCHVIQYVSDTPLESIDDFIKQIENYIKDEQ